MTGLIYRRLPRLREVAALFKPITRITFKSRRSDQAVFTAELLILAILRPPEG